MRATAAIVFGLLVAASGAAAQAPAPSLQEIQALLPADAARSVRDAVRRARAAGVPTQPLLDKAREGISKGVTAPRIVFAVEQLAQQLITARALLSSGPPPSAADVSAVADGIRRGVPANAVRTLRAQSERNEPIAPAVHAFADLLDRKVPVDGALDVLGAWRSRGADPEQLARIPIAVEHLVRSGMEPARAARQVAGSVRGGNALPGDGPPAVGGRGAAQPDRSGDARAGRGRGNDRRRND